MRRLFVLLAALAALAAPGSAAGKDSFSDPVGDAPTGPDIVAIDVESDGSTVAFRFTLAAPPGVDEGVRVAIDADQSRVTGTWIMGLGPSEGYDYVLGATANDSRRGSSCGLSRAAGDGLGAGFAAAASSTLSCTAEGSTQTLRIALSELGGTTRFSFSASGYFFDAAASRFVPGDVVPNCGVRVHDVGLGGQPAGTGCAEGPTAAERWIRVRVRGRGTVTSGDGSIECPTACEISFAAGETVTLRARARRGYVFRGWTGACSGRRACTIAVTDRDAAVTATFARAPSRPRRPRR